MVGVVGTIMVLAVTGASTRPATGAPAQSTYLSDVQINMGTVKKYADESDNFHLTWHQDGNLYGAYGDGWGFQRGSEAKRAIGVSRITGNPDSLKGVDTWEGDAQGQSCCWLPWNGKSWGMISVGAKLHMWFTIGRPRAMGFSEARIVTSGDNGKTWSKASWAFSPGDKFLMPSFMQAGKSYTSSDLPAEIMNYVYSYHTRYVRHPSYVQSPGMVDLVRVPKAQVANRASYEFFAGVNGAGQPIWTKDLNQRKPVLDKPYILDAPPAVSWNPHLKRFIMVMGHVTSNSAANIGVGFYEAEKPWGPWYKIKEQASFAEGTIFFYQLPTKWMNADLSAWMAFTGPDKEGGQEWDALDVVNVKFVKSGGGNPAPTAVADSTTTEVGTAVKIPVLANDTGTGLTISSITTPANGTKKKNADQTITYTPNAGFTGTDSFRYTAKDSSGRTASAAVSVTVSRTGPEEPVYLGCYADKGGTVTDPSENDLNGLFFKNDRMTTKLCTDRCQAEGFAFAATRNGYACFCGDSYGRFGAANTCNVACYGAPGEICGGVGVNSVYRLP